MSFKLPERRQPTSIKSMKSRNGQMIPANEGDIEHVDLGDEQVPEEVQAPQSSVNHIQYNKAGNFAYQSDRNPEVWDKVAEDAAAITSSAAKKISHFFKLHVAKNIHHKRIQQLLKEEKASNKTVRAKIPGLMKVQKKADKHSNPSFLSPNAFKVGDYGKASEEHGQASELINNYRHSDRSAEQEQMPQLDRKKENALLLALDSSQGEIDKHKVLPVYR